MYKFDFIFKKYIHSPFANLQFLFLLFKTGFLKKKLYPLCFALIKRKYKKNKKTYYSKHLLFNSKYLLFKTYYSKQAFEKKTLPFMFCPHKEEI